MKPEDVERLRQESERAIPIVEEWHREHHLYGFAENMRRSALYAREFLATCPTLSAEHSILNQPARAISQAAGTAASELVLLAEKGCTLSIRQLAALSVVLVESLERLIDDAIASGDLRRLEPVAEIAGTLPYWPILFQPTDVNGSVARLNGIAPVIGLAKAAPVLSARASGKGRRVFLRDRLPRLIWETLCSVERVISTYEETSRQFRLVQVIAPVGPLAAAVQHGASRDAFLEWCIGVGAQFPACESDAYRAGLNLGRCDAGNSDGWADSVIFPLIRLRRPDLLDPRGKDKKARGKTEGEIRRDLKKRIRQTLKSCCSDSGS